MSHVVWFREELLALRALVCLQAKATNVLAEPMESFALLQLMEKIDRALSSAPILKDEVASLRDEFLRKIGN